LRFSVLSDHPTFQPNATGSQSLETITNSGLPPGASQSSISPLSHLPQAPPPYSEAVDGHTERLGSDASDAPPYSELSPNSFPEQPAPILPAAAQGVDILPNTSNASGSIGRPTLTGAQLTGRYKYYAGCYHLVITIST